MLAELDVRDGYDSEVVKAGEDAFSRNPQASGQDGKEQVFVGL